MKITRDEFYRIATIGVLAIGCVGLWWAQEIIGWQMGIVSLPIQLLIAARCAAIALAASTVYGLRSPLPRPIDKVRLRQRMILFAILGGITGSLTALVAIATLGETMFWAVVATIIAGMPMAKIGTLVTTLLAPPR